MSGTASTLALSAAPPGAALHRFAWGVAGCTFVLILIGSMVTTTGSGLAVPDWPTTYGHNMFTFPPSQWVGGIFYEHVHRLVASGVGMLTVVLCIWLWRSPHPRLLKWLGTAAVVLVCGQGLLGGLTVLFKLPTWLSVAHAGTAQLFFCLTITLALATAPRRPVVAVPADRRLRRACLGLAVCVYLQILLGAVMRHTHSGLAVPDFPLTYGAVWPPVSETALDAINHQRAWGNPELEPTTLGRIWIHTVHRLGGLAVAVAVFLVVGQIWRRWARDRVAVLLAALLVGLVVLQIVLGALTVWSFRALPVTTAHVGGAALMLAISWILYRRSADSLAVENP